LIRLFKNRLRALLPPAIFLAITAYFAWNAVHGKSGLEAQQIQRAELGRAAQAFATVDAARSQWETRIAALNGRSISRDMLDDQARLVLNMAAANDLVVKLPSVPTGR
jgi:cell division protein FtsB